MRHIRIGYNILTDARLGNFNSDRILSIASRTKEHASYLHRVYWQTRASDILLLFWQNPVRARLGACVICASGILTDARLGHLNSYRILSEQDKGACVIFASGILTDARLGNLDSDRILSEQEKGACVIFASGILTDARLEHFNIILTESCPNRTWSMRHMCIGYTDRRAPRTS